MARKSSRELVGKIASVLNHEPQSIAEISRETGADRKAVTRYLEALTNHKYIEEVNLSGGRSRKFRIRGDSVDPLDDIPSWRRWKNIEEGKIEVMKQQGKLKKDFKSAEEFQEESGGNGTE